MSPRKARVTLENCAANRILANPVAGPRGNSEASWIPDPPKALQQMKRVLKPGGHLIFIEHGRSSDSGVAAWQERLNPVWNRIGGGCHLDRKIDDLLAAAGFQINELKTCYLPGPRPMTYTYQGLAHAE